MEVLGNSRSMGTYYETGTVSDIRNIGQTKIINSRKTDGNKFLG